MDSLLTSNVLSPGNLIAMQAMERLYHGLSRGSLTAFLRGMPWIAHLNCQTVDCLEKGWLQTVRQIVHCLVGIMLPG